MAAPDITSEISSNKVLIVEGKDDKIFLDELLAYSNISGVDVIWVGGKNEFNRMLPPFAKRPDFSKITHLGIIRDKNGDNAFKSIIGILGKMGFSEVPSEPETFSSGTPKIGVYIMPGDGLEGTMLEDLCLRIVESHLSMTCVNSFAECISAMNKPPENMSKAKVQAFLAAQPEVANTIGRGAQKGYWDFESSALDGLKAFLKQFNS